MLLILAAWAAYFFLAYKIITHDIQIGDFQTSILVICSAFFALFAWSVHHLKTQSQREAARRSQGSGPSQKLPFPGKEPAAGSTPAPDPVPAADPQPITFRVAGVTFENEDGTSRQDLLRHMKFGDPPWATSADPEDLDVYLNETIYDGEPAVEVQLNDYQVGYVPKKMVRKISAALNDPVPWYVSDVRIIGGGTDDDGNRLSYGCQITLDR